MKFSRKPYIVINVCKLTQDVTVRQNDFDTKHMHVIFFTRFLTSFGFVFLYLLKENLSGRFLISG